MVSTGHHKFATVVYFIFTIMVMHYGILNEEKINIEKFGQEYADYMKRVPRYFFIQ